MGPISLGFTRRLEDLVKGFGPDISQGHPFVGLGRNVWRSGSAQDRINSSPDDPTDLSNVHNSNPTFPRCVLKRRNRMAISRQSYRKIGSVDSLLPRHTLLSYPHVTPHVEYIRPRGHPLKNISLLSHLLSSLAPLELENSLVHTKDPH